MRNNENLEYLEIASQYFVDQSKKMSNPKEYLRKVKNSGLDLVEIKKAEDNMRKLGYKDYYFNFENYNYMFEEDRSPSIQF